MNPQPNFVNSIGGFPSSTLVPNDMFSNLFDDLSLLELKDIKTQYKAIILHNDSPDVCADVELWFEPGESIVCDFQIGATLLAESPDGTRYMESIPTPYSKPFNTALYTATVEDKVTIGDLQPDQMVGLWISRAIDKELAYAEYNNVAEPSTVERTRWKPIEKNKQEELKLQISWK